MNDHPRIIIVGLGYVGLPLAVALARKFNVVGFDIDEGRVRELGDGFDRTNEVSEDDLRGSRLELTSAAADCARGDIYVVTVPTPVDEMNRPDLTPVLAATRQIATWLDATRRPLVIYESTVYPGVTEDICGPEIERCANLQRGRDFRLGYSPERINPGDRQHTIDKITKVIAAEDAEVMEQMASIYGAITEGGVFRAASIKAAEAAKAIENAQRDINIAFMNEIARIFSRIGVSVWDVLAAAKTKWNFLPFEPGLVGGHCIGVDPYYLSHLAHQLGYDPQVILSGRAINDSMGAWIADALHDGRRKSGTALVLGLSFKENVPDIRNSRSFDIVRRLEWLGYDVSVCDPVANAEEVFREHGLAVTQCNDSGYDVVIAAVAHDAFRQMSNEQIARLVAEHGTLADLKGMWRDRSLENQVNYWLL